MTTPTSDASKIWRQTASLTTPTTPTPDEICERLRAVESAAPEWHDGPTTCWHRNPDGPEAADLIQQQLAEIERLSAALEDCRDVLRDVPAPHWAALWSRILAAIRNADAALGKDASDE